jgi:hypothetical protein
MPEVGLNPRSQCFERAETVHALDRAATVIGPCYLYELKFYAVVGSEGLVNIL